MLQYKPQLNAPFLYNLQLHLNQPINYTYLLYRYYITKQVYITKMNMEIQQLLCPICMMVFKIPITTQCGHTFCRSCLISSTVDNRICPICRQHISHTPSKIGQDDYLFNFISEYRKNNNLKKPQKKQQSGQIECKIQQLLLIDAKTDDLLLPFNRITATFELQNHIIIDKMDRFVARQESPFNKYGVICRLVSINQLRVHLYQGLFQGKALCHIVREQVQTQVSLQTQEEYHYRKCTVKQICETSDLSSTQYDTFFRNFKKITNTSIKQEIYKKIDSKVFFHGNDGISIFYSIMGILAMTNQQKYKLVISFNEQYRIHQINALISKIQHLIDRNASSLITLPQQRTKNQKYFYVVLALMFFLYLFNIYEGEA